MINSASSVLLNSEKCAPDALSENALSELVPKPRTLEQTGIPPRILESLLLKHLSQATDLDVQSLSQSLALSGNLIDLLLQKLKAEALVEVRSDGRFERGMRYGLTQKGMQFSQHELQRDGYLGPAPIPLELYKQLVVRQSSKHEAVTPDSLKAGLNDLILNDKLVAQLGPALNSGRAIFIYGLPGTGKTYVSRRLVRLFKSNVFIPYAVCIGHQIIQVFDPIIHETVEPPVNQNLKTQSCNTKSLRLDDGYDDRFVLCKRPEVVVGGELTSEMLEVSMDPTHKINRAPLQMKANNGILLIDDLGRQKISVDAILNRWIVPLEERIDYLAMASGEHFDIPFEQVLVFSSNFHPSRLADDAFLRRIGYKIEFEPISQDDYHYLWLQECNKHDLSLTKDCLTLVVNKLHIEHSVPFLPCYPRDLVAMCSNQIDFFQLAPQIDQQMIEGVWNSYFVDQIDENNHE